MVVQYTPRNKAPRKKEVKQEKQPAAITILCRFSSYLKDLTQGSADQPLRTVGHNGKEPRKSSINLRSQRIELERLLRNILFNQEHQRHLHQRSLDLGQLLFDLPDAAREVL